jgi:uncharacterized membrane protein
MNSPKSRYLFIAIVVFGIIYSLISLVNHYLFRTYALDLGVYTNALYDYIHFQWNDSAVFKVVKENLLADHFDLYLILFSPFSLLLGSYTLLILQIAFVLIGGTGVYRYFRLTNKGESLPLYAAIYFWLFFGVFSAISFDYHSNVIAACLVPWFFYYLKKRKVFRTSMMILLILISKENVSLWLAFICLGLIVENRKDPFWRNYLVFAFLICLWYFFLITFVVIPHLSVTGTYDHFNYSFLGNNFTDSLVYLLKHPLESLQVLFTNHTHHPFGDFVKTEFNILVLLSGLPLLLLKPQYLVMLIPVYFQKLFNDNYLLWGSDAQYNIELAPILAIGIFSVIRKFRNRTLSKLTTFTVLVLAFGCTIRIMDSPILYTNKSKIRIYQASHYSRDYPVSKVYWQLDRIPRNAVVSAQSPFVPHLAYRDNIYEFPILKDAEFVVFSRKEGTYPLDQKKFDSLTFSMENSKKWSVIFRDKDLTVLRKVHAVF